MTKTVGHARIARWGACADQAQKARELYPDGVPLTCEATVALREAGCDVLWGLVHLLTKRQRRAFILFTLEQRQPHLVTLLRRAGVGAQADAVAALDWCDLKKAERVCRAAGDAAWTAARGATRDAAWAAQVAGAGAGAAAWAAWDAAWAAAWAAARDAARAVRDAAGGTSATGITAAGASAVDEQVRWCLAALGVEAP